MSYCEMPACYALKIRKARKQHKCCECAGIISAGEKYNYHSGIWDGTPESYKVCTDCDRLRETVRKDCDLYHDEGIALGNMRYDLCDFDEAGIYVPEFKAIQQRRGVIL